MWTDHFDIYLITLSRRHKERLSVAMAELHQYKIPFMVIPGIDDPTDGAFGIFQTIQMYLSLHRDGNKIPLFFEDDVRFLTNPNPVMEKCLEQLNACAWDIFYMGINAEEKFVRFHSPNLLQIKKGFALHAVAYHPRIVPKILGFKYTGTPLDVMLYDHVQTDGRCFCSYPLLATQRSGYSDIQKKYMDQSYIEQRYVIATSHLLYPQ
ncbi:MAG TPA: hypothetical protein VFV08_12700 [Puia sp.]|nr:hypothetical protein [Puia sp.]